VTNAALRTLQVCRERLGARGMLDVNRISRYVGFVNGAITAEGENQVIALAAGRWIAAGRGYEPPADAGDATATSLDDPALWKRLATTRETQAIRRLRQTLDDERLTDPFARWNAATVPALDVVDAYTHRLCVEAYLQAITEPVTDPDRALLRSLALLYVLDDVRTHAAEYASRGLLTPTQLATLGAQADDAYAALTPHTEHLADAYAIDAERLAVP
jgi:acyl-CoA oxidase